MRLYLYAWPLLFRLGMGDNFFGRAAEWKMKYSHIRDGCDGKGDECVLRRRTEPLAMGGDGRRAAAAAKRSVAHGESVCARPPV